MLDLAYILHYRILNALYKYKIWFNSGAPCLWMTPLEPHSSDPVSTEPLEHI